MPVSPKPGSSPFWAAWSPSTAAGRSELAPGSAGELAARPRPGAGMSTSITHLWRLVRWGRTLARHGAPQGIERDPLTDPTSVVVGKSVSVRVDLGGSRCHNKKKNNEKY